MKRNCLNQYVEDCYVVPMKQQQQPACFSSQEACWVEASTGDVELALQSCHENLSGQPENKYLCFHVVTRKGDCGGVY